MIEVTQESRAEGEREGYPGAMRFCQFFPVLALAALPLWAGAREGAVLDYRLEARIGDDPAVVATRFRLEATPALVTRNRVKRLRMGRWRIVPEPGAGAAPPPELLVRALGLCYFSGPAGQTVALPQTLTIGGRRCRLWQVRTPPGVGCYAYLAEVAPGLLALAYLSANLPGEDFRTVELHLTGLTLGPKVAPAEDGTALLNTLQHWAARRALPAGTHEAKSGTQETEEVP